MGAPKVVIAGQKPRLKGSETWDLHPIVDDSRVGAVVIHDFVQLPLTT